MSQDRTPLPAIVVGIDGSRRGIGAALWAVPEAVSRDVPLRLVYAVEPDVAVPRDAGVGEDAVRAASAAIEAAGRPVKIEAEIVVDRPLPALLAAARSSDMICVGALGLNRAAGRRLGSTADALLARAHCAVAIVGVDAPTDGDPREIVTSFHGSVSDMSVLRHAIDEARLRRAPLRIVTGWHPTFSDVYDDRSFAEGTRRARARLERWLSPHRCSHPELSITTCAVPGGLSMHLTQSVSTPQLVVVGSRRREGLAEIIGPHFATVLSRKECSALVVPQHGAL